MVNLANLPIFLKNLKIPHKLVALPHEYIALFVSELEKKEKDSAWSILEFGLSMPFH